MRFFAKPCKYFVVPAVLLFASATPTLAQQFAGSQNSRIGTIGDLSSSKLRSRTASSFNLQLGPAALFAGSDVFNIPSFRSFSPFTFPLPDFSGSQDFTDVSFGDYLQTLADRFNLADAATYRSFFLAQNEFTLSNGGTPLFFLFGDLQQQFFSAPSTIQPFLITTLNNTAFDRLHQQAFLAGGGFLQFGPPTIPTDPKDKPPVFVPLPNDGTIGPDGKPFVPFPVPGAETTTDTPTDTNDVANLATEIVGGGTLNVDSTGSLTLEGNSVVGESRTAANVAVVPEPATLGLLTLGTALMLGRRRR